ncbi:MAG: ATP-binding protein [candidate division WOR-3 bacterium]|nr:ATP-binding protein [candidate division WOR-3 bacterium]
MNNKSKEDFIYRYLDCWYEIVNALELKEFLENDNDMYINWRLNKPKIYYQELLRVKKQLNRLNKELGLIKKAAAEAGVDIPFEELAKKFNLSEQEKLIIMCIFFKGDRNFSSHSKAVNLHTIGEVLGKKPSKLLKNLELLNGLVKKELVKRCDYSSLLNFNEKTFTLSDEVLSTLLTASLCDFYHENRARDSFELGPTIEFSRSSTVKDKDIEDIVDTTFPTINDNDNDKDIVDTKKTSEINDDKPSETLNEIFPSILIDRIIDRKKASQLLVIRKPIIGFSQIVLPKSYYEELEKVVSYVKEGAKVLSDWGLDKTIKYGKGIIMLFYGPPGTGKTATAEAFAHRLGKNIGIVRYDQILSYWIGDSEKKIVQLFADARESDCVLVFDEADALFGRRLLERHSVDRMSNFMTNIMMQEMEHFDGVVILTTNREYALDEAFPRRILYKFKFDIPGPEDRERIWRVLISKKTPLADDVDFKVLAREYELTGGEIKNVILKVVHECIYHKTKLITMEMLMRHAQTELKHNERKTRFAIGFKPNNK